MDERIKKYMEPLDELERLIAIRDSLNATIRNCRSKQKALKRELEYGFNRTGVRGGKFTTIAANAMKISDQYYKGIELVKEMTKHI